MVFDPSKAIKKMIGPGVNVPRFRQGRNARDTDGDGIPDIMDCQPRNMFRQDNIIKTYGAKVIDQDLKRKGRKEYKFNNGEILWLVKGKDFNTLFADEFVELAENKNYYIHDDDFKKESNTNIKLLGKYILTKPRNKVIEAEYLGADTMFYNILENGKLLKNKFVGQYR